MERAEFVAKYASRDRFRETFWKNVQKYNLKHIKMRYEDIYEEMERIYVAEMGLRLFPSYEAFRTWRTRHPASTESDFPNLNLKGVNF